LKSNLWFFFNNNNIFLKNIINDNDNDNNNNNNKNNKNNTNDYKLGSGAPARDSSFWGLVPLIIIIIIIIILNLHDSSSYNF
jgi:hypothetical protein